ncbi:hypothetical protein UFOVP1648_4 [uncultured Caudovirales phage]|uniref:Uncharacterized protein n=1 Tax=uncultured Caudovirales phage TaxID=2100421 RepID=A0A6J5T2P9_9CAUD|nr:hypothetical protein UFOVP1648_4 [uncultured Caudovirales phage]
MARLKITRASGDVIVAISPVVEYSFEKYTGNGIHKQFRDAEKQSDIYWLAHNALSRIEVLPPFGEEFLQTLISVEVMDDEPTKK